MAKQPDMGKPALFKYARVDFRHIVTSAGEQRVLTADPWSYLHSFLIGKIANSRGSNRECFIRANYYANLAEDFYKASEHASLPTKATLCYYGMLNLVKAFISVEGVELETSHEHHGMVLTHGKEYQVTVQKKVKPSIGKNIFYEFTEKLGMPVKLAEEINIIEACLNIPELHSICRKLGYGGQKQRFLPVDISINVTSDHKWLFSVLSYRKEDEMRTRIDRLLKGTRKNYFLEGVDGENGKVNLRSRKRKNVDTGDWNRCYQNILREYQSHNISSMLSSGGYRYYINLNSPNYHHLAYSIIAMFYAGTVARYRPSEVKKIMEGHDRAIYTEAVALLPKQFLYQMTSLITKDVCVIPYSNL